MNNFSSPTPVEFLPDILHWRAETTPDKTAFVFLKGNLDETARLTYAAFDRKVDTVAGALRARVAPGDRALLLYPTGPEFVIAFFACLKTGVIAVPCPPLRRNRDLDRIAAIAADSRPSLVLTTQQGNAARSQDAAQSHTWGMEIPWLETDGLSAGRGSDAPRCDVDQDAAAFLQYTSGSTGHPKGVTISHRNLMHNEALIGEAFAITSADVSLGWLPHFHDMGLIGTLLQPVVAGIPAYVMAPADVLRRPIVWLEAISRFGATVSGGPNFIYDYCARKAPSDFGGIDLSQWRLAFNGAEPVRPASLDHFAETFAPAGFSARSFYPCYGLAEATLIVTGPTAGDGAGRSNFSRAMLETGKAVATEEPNGAAPVGLVSCGRPIGGQTVVIVDPESGNCCADGDVGEIWVSGPSVARGYWGQDAESTETFAASTADGLAGPALRTGDLGFLHDGELFVTGRLKDLIILRGRNIYPQDIETATSIAHEACQLDGAAAIAVDDGEEERLVVLQEIRRDRMRDLDAPSVMNAIRRVLSEQFEVQPAAIQLLPPHALPRTSSGKLRRGKCSALYAAGELKSLAREDLEPDTSDATGTAADPSIVAELSAILGDVLRRPVDTIGAELSLSELGIDSLGVLELSHEIESRFGVTIPPSEDFLEKSIEELAGILGNREALNTGAAGAEEQTSDAAVDLFDKCHGDGGYFGYYRKTGDKYYSQPVLEGEPGPDMTFGGVPQIVWSINNYLGLCGDPRLTETAQAALDTYGSWAPMGSRMLTGNTDRHQELENRLAEMLGKEASVVFNYGYMGVMGTMASLVGEADQIVIDSLCHACIVDGAHLASKDRPFRVFRHNDLNSLEDQLRQANRNRRGGVMVVTEGVYGMSGDIAPLPEIIALKDRYGARLFVDDAHGFGIMGKTGAGLGEHQDCMDGIDLYFGTFAKSFVGIGGFTAGDAAVTDYIRYNSRPNVFAKSLPLIYVETAHRVLDIMAAEPERLSRAWDVAARLQAGLRDLGFDLGNTESVITPVYIEAGNEEAARDVVRFMREEEGIFLSAVTYPVVPRGVVLLRMTPTAAHTFDHVDRTLTAFERLRTHLRGAP